MYSGSCSLKNLHIPTVSHLTPTSPRESGQIGSPPGRRCDMRDAGREILNPVLRLIGVIRSSCEVDGSGKTRRRVSPSGEHHNITRWVRPTNPFLDFDHDDTLPPLPLLERGMIRTFYNPTPPTLLSNETRHTSPRRLLHHPVYPPANHGDTGSTSCRPTPLPVTPSYSSSRYPSSPNSTVAPLLLTRAFTNASLTHLNLPLQSQSPLLLPLASNHACTLTALEK